MSAVISQAHVGRGVLPDQGGMNASRRVCSGPAAVPRAHGSSQVQQQSRRSMIHWSRTTGPQPVSSYSGSSYPGDYSGSPYPGDMGQEARGYNEELPSDAEVVPLGRSQDGGQISGRFGSIASAAVAGATGGCGRAVVARLVAEGVPVLALVRDYTKAANSLPGRDRDVDIRQVDVTQMMGLPEALRGQDALIIATGSRPALDPLGPFNVDYQGTVNLIEAAKAAGVKKVVLVTSVGTDEPFFPLNLLWGVLFWKKRAEEALQRSGLDYTIVRPGGLVDAPRGNRVMGGVVMAGPSTYGLPPKQQPGSILRSRVADVCVEALVEEAASNRVVEITQGDGTQPVLNIAQLFRQTRPQYM
eukprot:CAMPEP_0206148608 /NCGR_PEP_ID=MMETSP1473-20131121/37139_1 /ASSEMBLY_ACC=CAM_ASM_001109 /TAXON_ID=1461547 /ORGANISM="Stichococcus sp, Strain RCC1054" /LENGTH=357 /DNA_ID=CAMNT_0053546003 /DNA_START=45 /DNA_END=1118 /DNA_ORIENTATION=-